MRPIWDEAGLEQAVAQQIGDPFGILDVRLATGHGFDVLGVGEQHLKLALEQVIGGLPVHAGALHGHVGDTLGGQPVG